MHPDKSIQSGLRRSIYIWLTFSQMFVLLATPVSCSVTIDDSVEYHCSTHKHCGAGWLCVCPLGSDGGGVCKPSAAVSGTGASRMDGDNACLTPASSEFDDVDVTVISPKDVLAADSHEIREDMDDIGGDADNVEDTSIDDTFDSTLDVSFDVKHSPCEVDKDCDDDLECTVDICSEEAVCVHTANSAKCYPGPVCWGSYCDITEGCVLSPLDGDFCDDGNPCTVDDQCNRGRCVGTQVVCPDDDNPCTAAVCDGLSGCNQAPVDNEPCEDGEPCTFPDLCDGGECKPGAPVSCDDTNPCTIDDCAMGVGCSYVPTTGPCDDKNLCTVNDACSGALCVGGSPKNCDDGEECTKDTCDPVKGCLHANLGQVCDDGNECTTATCSNGVCKLVATIVCNDGNACTVDSCDPKVGCQYVATSAPCDDDNPCTTGDFCAATMCLPGKVPLSCDDNNPCTEDSCSTLVGCTFLKLIGNACNDGNECTTGDKCTWTSGTCTGTDIVCDDNNPCTTDSCEAVVGCTYLKLTGKACIDGNACTTGDTCTSGTCSGAAVVCNDNNPCTADSCYIASGCSYSNVALPCSDGSVCTTGDKCASGSCSGAAVVCNDTNPCTADSCDPKVGCQYTPISVACNDNNPCTVGDICAAKTCTSGKVPLNCDDGNPCTTDSCDPPIGCVHLSLSGPQCDDGDSCTAGDSCVSGSCEPGTPVEKPGCGADAPKPVCELFGAAGATVDCPLLLAAASADDPLCTGLQFTLQYNFSKVQLVNFFDEACFTGIGCFPVAVTGAGAFPLSTGHSVSIGPQQIVNWNKQVACSAASPCANDATCINGGCEGTGGFGGVVIINLTSTAVPISEAVVDAGGNLTGDPQFMIVRFTLSQTIDAATPEVLLFGSSVGADASSETLEVVVDNQLIISSKQ
ncbi:MAG: hypothetical protein HUU55_20235 [Myxococcales bacterium]|nr:hypothetical protein [Myxococcales bacterium]